MEYSEEYMLIVERQFINYMRKVALGVRRDYHRKLAIETARSSCLYEFSADMRIDLGLNGTSTSVDPDFFENKLLFEAYGKLTEKQKDILLKVVIEEMTEAEVAAILCKSQQYVNSTKKKAIKKIRKHFEGDPNK
jgi:RNA polymerase sigma factor (sigma-70 family)